MQGLRDRLKKDLAVRACGLFLLVLGALAIGWLVDADPAAMQDGTSATELASAAIGFTGLSAGSVLAVLGHHVFDSVALAEHWRSPFEGSQRPGGARIR